MKKTEYNPDMKEKILTSPALSEEIPEIIDLGSISDLTNGLGGGKEPGGFDGDFAPLQVS